ncbi:MAG: T9SS type A sorting domain-containing protein [Dyadobacter sp.]|uniref:T9SS type A sorting domain-containing protein n=1 Tax=Dyadobacter sp. TaxID=1914288 RepID=UPI001B00B0CA|nr:T9SS type A sorting domain-containing protein [Dyadobacter sp.]MBO9614626.1 T9SS type A sorting domain-containing protein [Dyadobacter sp.]
MVASPAWKNGSLDSAGAVTWCDGASGRVGVESAAISLIGGSAKDKVGLLKPVGLTNGNYVFSSPYWKNGSAENAGAVTWCNGATGATGLVSISNSLVGTDGTDFVGGVQPVYWPIFSLESESPRATVVPLTNGNYVVISFNWNRSGIKWAGAVTWGNGATGTFGAVSPVNSLVGTVAMDRVGQLGVTALANGHYVVSSPLWNNGAKLRVGAVTWCDGFTGRVGDVTIANSFVGSNQDDHIAGTGTTALTNGNYVIKSRDTQVNGMEQAGMATWADGSGVLTGSPDLTNSIYGSKPSDLVGWYVIPLPNGGYLVNSNSWNGAAGYEGALTYGNGTAPIVGPVSSANSLVGTYHSDRVGIEGVNVLPDGNFFLVNRHWNNGVGAVTWVNSATAGTSGEVNDCNSALGNPVGPLGTTVGVYNPVYNYVISGKIGRTVLVFYYPTGAPFLSKNADTGSAMLNPSQATSLMGGTGCRIIATVESQGASPVTGNISAKTWLETAVPTFGADPFVARHYEITPEQNAATATGRVTLYFSQDDFDAFNAASGSTLDLPANAADAAGKANLRVGKYSGSSSDGTGLPGSYPSVASTIIDPVDTDIVWNDTFKRWEVTFDTQGFSGFVVQTSPVPLPVRLVAFSAKPEGKAVKLDWQIADAVNFSHFEIEHGPDAKQFESFGKVDFEENTAYYSATDDQPRTNSAGQTYYRLKMLDLDGSYAFSKVLSVQLDGGNTAYVYPNPVNDHVKLSLPGYDGKTGIVKLVNASGKVLRQETRVVANGEIRMDMKPSQLEEGIYTIQLELGGERRQFKVAYTR